VLLMLVLACAAVQCTQASAPPSALSSTAAAGQRASEDITTAAADTNKEQQQQPQADADNSTDDADSGDDSTDEDSSWGALGVPFTAAGAVLETAGNNVIEVLEDPSVVDIHGIEVRGGSRKGAQLLACGLSATAVNAAKSFPL
jgi:hypothetical protein